MERVKGAESAVLLGIQFVLCSVIQNRFCSTYLMVIWGSVEEGTLILLSKALFPEAT